MTKNYHMLNYMFYCVRSITITMLYVPKNEQNYFESYKNYMKKMVQKIYIFTFFLHAILCFLVVILSVCSCLRLTTYKTYIYKT